MLTASQQASGMFGHRIRQQALQLLDGAAEDGGDAGLDAQNRIRQLEAELDVMRRALQDARLSPSAEALRRYVRDHQLLTSRAMRLEQGTQLLLEVCSEARGLVREAVDRVAQPEPLGPAEVGLQVLATLADDMGLHALLDPAVEAAW